MKMPAMNLFDFSDSSQPCYHIQQLYDIKIIGSLLGLLLLSFLPNVLYLETGVNINVKIPWSPYGI